MLKRLLAGIWRRAPKQVRRWTTRLTQARFAVTAAAILLDNEGRVLLLQHTFRPGTGWGLPGGFLLAGEQPEVALRRELQEEVGLTLHNVHFYTVRVFKRPNQLEIVFRGTTGGEAKPQSMEINKVGWFKLNDLPEGLPNDQRQLIQRALSASKEM